MEREQSLILEVNNLKKIYRNGVEAVKGIDIHLDSQEVCALLGPNGAGKTTTLKSILDLVNYEGEIKVFDKPVREVKDRISFVPEEKLFYENMDVNQSLKILNKILTNFDIARAEELVDYFDLPRNKKISGFSNGMKTSAYLSFAFAQNVDLYILDEPTWGLDPIKRDDVLEMIRQLVIEGKSVLYTSHIIPEVQKIAERMYIMHKGKIHYSGSIDELKENYRVFYMSRDLYEKLSDETFYAVVNEKERVSAISDDQEQWNKLTVMNNIEKDTCDLEKFFQIIIRSEQN
ncbi:MAG: ABC transporter ATP-binding protein [Kosmotoga sp.]|jgi:ABC-2 type transport system ATP-binding protein|nr:MAG: ABC transporter ATP-binding protein [Kosmotoga sp.]